MQELDSKLATFDWATEAERIAASEAPAAGGAFCLSADLRFSRLQKEHKLAILAAFATNTTAHSVELAGVGLDDDAADAIARVLAQNCTLSVLNVESNAFSGRGAA
jgi:hypothetical protein